jgi:hypothetical protein
MLTLGGPSNEIGGLVPEGLAKLSAFYSAEGTGLFGPLVKTRKQIVLFHVTCLSGGTDHHHFLFPINNQ